MKSVALLTVLGLALASCTTGNFDSGPGIQPIPGSITYGGQPRTRLTKSPIGSVVPHEFRDRFGQRVEETYILQPDRSLKLIDRHVIPEPIFD